MSAGSPSLKRAILLMAFTGLNTIAVFLYLWFVVTRLGLAGGSDALFIAMAVPQLALNVITGSLAFVLVPLLATSMSHERSALVWTYAVGLGFIFSAVAALLALLAPLWVPLVALGFDRGAQVLTIELTRIQLLGMALLGLGTPFISAMHAQHRFVYPMIATLVASLVSLAFLAFTLSALGIAGAAWGLVLRSFLQTALMLPGALPIVAPDFRANSFRQSLTRLLPLLGGATYYKTDLIVDRMLASLAVPGAVSLLHLAQQIYGAMFQVLVNAIAAPSVPVLAALAGRHDLEGFNAQLVRSTMHLLSAGALVFLGVVMIGPPFLTQVFQGPRFGETDIHALWVIMLAGGLVWVAGLWGQLLSTALYATRDTKTPTLVGTIGFTLGIPVKIAGYWLFGVAGIVLGSGIFTLANAIAMNGIIRSRLRSRTLFDRLPGPTQTR